MSKLFPFTVLAALGAGMIAGCNTPTLPLPPPSEGAIVAQLDLPSGEARVIGKSQAVEAYALVTCFNNRTGGGVVGLAKGNGGFEIRVAAQQGDVIEVWQRVHNDPPSVVVSVE